MARRRRLGIATTCVAVTFALVGCAPAVLGVAGLERVGNEFRLVVATCEGFRLFEVDLLDRSQVNDQQEFAAIASWRLSDEQNGIADADVSDSFWDVLTAGNEYMLWGEEGGLPPRVVVGPVFGSADLEQLDDAEVLTIDSESFETIVLSTRDEMAGLRGDLSCD